MHTYNIKTLFQKNQLLFQVFLLIGLNYFVTRYFYQALATAEFIYTQSSIFYNLYEYSSLSLSLFMFAPILLYNIKWKDLISKNFISIKYFIFFIFSIYAWGVITLDYNLYFNQAYHIDRIVLLILFILSFRVPLAFIYFIILSLLFFNQVSYPNFECDFPKVYVYIKPLLEVLILFIVFMFVKRVYKKLSILAFFIVVLCFHASNYFIPGLGKIRLSTQYIDWIWTNDLGNILIAKYSHGWLASLINIDTMQVIVSWVSYFTVPMQLFAFLIQTIVLFIFINKRFSVILFISFELLHLGIFMASGIFFWRWMLLNFAIVYVIQNLDTNYIKKIFNYKIMLFSMPFIFLGYGFFHSYWLAWYDTPLNNFHKVYAITENGEKYEIDNNLFAPYDRAFYRNTLNSFIDTPLKSRWDTTNQKIMEEITKLSYERNLTSINKKIFNFEQKYGQNEFDKTKQIETIRFIKIFFKNLNNYQNQKIIWNYLSPVRDMYRLFNWNAPLNKNAKIIQVEIVSYKNFYNHQHDKLISLEEKSIVKIKIE